jgi:hypothetical protein
MYGWTDRWIRGWMNGYIVRTDGSMDGFMD